MPRKWNPVHARNGCLENAGPLATCASPRWSSFAKNSHLKLNGEYQEAAGRAVCQPGTTTFNSCPRQNARLFSPVLETGSLSQEIRAYKRNRLTLSACIAQAA